MSSLTALQKREMEKEGGRGEREGEGGKEGRDDKMEQRSQQLLSYLGGGDFFLVFCFTISV